MGRYTDAPRVNNLQWWAFFRKTLPVNNRAYYHASVDRVQEIGEGYSHGVVGRRYAHGWSCKDTLLHHSTCGIGMGNCGAEE